MVTAIFPGLSHSIACLYLPKPCLIIAGVVDFCNSKAVVHIEGSLWQTVEEHEMLPTLKYLHWLDHLFHKVSACSVSQSTFSPWIVPTFQ